MTIDEMLGNASSVAIFGHVRPDGDCVGSTVALYNYIKDNYPNTKATVFVEEFPQSYFVIEGTESTVREYDGSTVDLAFLLDAPTFDRIGANGKECFEKAKFTCNIDHHVSNPLNLCCENFVEPEASSTCEVLYYLLDHTKVSKRTANALYLGIIHDTGAFKFSCTSKRTMNAVGDLIEKGIDFAKIINETYYTRSHVATILSGVAMQKSKTTLEGKVVYSFITAEEAAAYNAKPVEFNSIIDLLREVSGTEVAIFLYPVHGEYKISLRSNYIVDVNQIAKEFGGGGHVRAAGAGTSLKPEDAIAKIIELVKAQLK